MSIKKSNNEFNDINNLTFYQNELAKKDRQILFLQKKINSLLFNKNSLISHLENSNNKNIPSLKSISPQNNSKNKLYSSFNALQNENSLLKNKLNMNKIQNMNEQIGEKYNNTFKYKLLSAQREVENLTIMNTSKDKIIMSMQKFINNLNKEVSNGKIKLDINQIDIKTFIINLKKLEDKIIKILQKIQRPNKIPEFIIKRAKDNSIKKQKTEVSLVKRKHLYIFPFNQRNHKLNTQISVYESKNSNSFKNQNFTCQNYTKKPIKELQFTKRIGSTNTNLKENKIKLKRYLLNKKIEIYNKIPIKKHMKSLDNKMNGDNFKTINYELSFFKIPENGNDSLHRKSIDK